MVNSGTMLIVDDDPAIRKMMATVISSYSKSYKIATDGLEALELIKKNDIDIVISDIKLSNFSRRTFNLSKSIGCPPFEYFLKGLKPPANNPKAILLLNWLTVSDSKVI